MILDLPVAGVFLGSTRYGTPVTLPAVRPVLTRVGLIGGIDPAVLLAYRMLAVGCQLTVATARPQAWTALAAWVNERQFAVVESLPRWLGSTPGPPGSAAGPQVIIADQPVPPPAELANAPWCTVIHVATHIPGGSEFWRLVDLVLLTTPGHGRALAGMRNRPDAVAANDLPPGHFALVDWQRTTLFRILRGAGENDLNGSG
jgi:hypothetical protein